jgi:hypothetical protein
MDDEVWLRNEALGHALHWAEAAGTTPADIVSAATVFAAFLRGD